MAEEMMYIGPFSAADTDAVVSLWKRCELTRDWNDPAADIARKLKVNPELFLVGKIDDNVVATVMGGYEGHRGWINYLAVEPSYQKRGLGRQMMRAVENKLLELGCPKVNLQIRSGNEQAVTFYQKIGYNTEDRISMGRRLIED